MNFQRVKTKKGHTKCTEQKICVNVSPQASCLQIIARNCPKRARRENENGTNIEIGEECYINFNCSFIDDYKIRLGNNVMLGPSVTIATVGHPINPRLREYMYCEPVIIEDNCWIGTGSIICPGVTIGKNSVIGAGSVVLIDIPENSVAAGNPCAVIRQIDERDEKYYYKDREITKQDLDEEASYR